MSLIGDNKDGGLKAPHVESIIKTQRIMVCKRFADSEPCACKTFLSHYLKPVGDKIILFCDFDVKKLPINLPRFYRKFFECFIRCSAATRRRVTLICHMKKYPTPSYGIINSFALMVNSFQSI